MTTTATPQTNLTTLKNIGSKVAARLHEIGIYTEQDLRAMGPVKAYQWMQRNYPDETLPVCYYLYSLEGALTQTHWDAVPAERKQQLRTAAKATGV